jgi:hypothetical protein
MNDINVWTLPLMDGSIISYPVEFVGIKSVSTRNIKPIMTLHIPVIRDNDGSYYRLSSGLMYDNIFSYAIRTVDHLNKINR